MKIITKSAELVMWLADDILLREPLADVPVGIVELYKGLIAMFIEFGDMRNDDFYEDAVSRWLREASAKPETMRCNQHTVEMISCLIMAVARCEFSVSLETFIDHLTEGSVLLKHLRFRKSKSQTKIESLPSLHGMGIKIDVTLRATPEEDMQVVYRWITDRRASVPALRVKSSSDRAQRRSLN
ncbi:hypothetical protein NKJ16_30210 [Mesorhizobium sp. M0179]|uniref:hypothetical protein n=1 Tax=unclassified Mesorhizobium TaxID=325217 RepID=UPI0003CE1764|nr:MULTISPECIES: hypothetical protein [unclassified Mesorhizobium]ESW94604.1 hypothetical protein X768_33855 [Mesorhizobium sp. LSJC265A00]ESY04446.1 hypothetical protein X753_17680 [Mesorhizobium sp. LNJC399B00]WJI67192.1 hypothetical protein NLY36_20075 [Mesorhizobium sp. C399B]